jgi:uncharacterized protein (DUF924 family)/acyl-CoA thioesterase FadM
VLDLHDPVPGADLRRHLPFTVRRRLHWGDSDSAQIGYTTRFVDIALEAAEFWWEAVLGEHWLAIRRLGRGCPMVSLQFDFASPVRSGERMDLTVTVGRLGRSALTLDVAGARDGSAIFRSRLTSALIDLSSGRPLAYPEDWRALIEGYGRECERAATAGHRSRQEVLDFWFVPCGHPEHGIARKLWFGGAGPDRDALDAEIRDRFLATHEAAAAGELDHWMLSPAGSLALAVVLDQFPRHMFRGTPRAFATDAKARDVARRAVAAGHDRGMHATQALFIYLPFEHSEDLADQEESLRLFGRFAEQPPDPRMMPSVHRHHEIIARFGRFPHRNAILGRQSTAQEVAFLQEPNSSF